MKRWADKKRRDLEFEIGDKVYLKAQQYRFKSLASRPNEKLSPRFYGPFKVLEKIGTAAYRLDLPAHSKIHPVFRVPQLKRAFEGSELGQQLPAKVNGEWEIQVTPKEVARVRQMQDGTKHVLRVWEGLHEWDRKMLR
jgi:hypothetical protein